MVASEYGIAIENIHRFDALREVYLNWMTSNLSQILLCKSCSHIPDALWSQLIEAFQQKRTEENAILCWLEIFKTMVLVFCIIFDDVLLE